MDSLSKHMLYPATVFVDSVPTLVSTILGSCVSVCLYDTKLMHGSINHYILPYWNGHDESTMKYGNLSIIKILEELLKLGSKYEDIVAKVYGGAAIIVDIPTNFHIGERNIKIAVEILNELKIPVIASNVGGNSGRKIVFNTYTGEVVCETIVNREKENNKHNYSHTPL